LRETLNQQTPNPLVESLRAATEDLTAIAQRGEDILNRESNESAAQILSQLDVAYASWYQLGRQTRMEGYNTFVRLRTALLTLRQQLGQISMGEGTGRRH
jgi:hypothetical protein